MRLKHEPSSEPLHISAKWPLVCILGIPTAGTTDLYWCSPESVDLWYRSIELIYEGWCPLSQVTFYHPPADNLPISPISYHPTADNTVLR